MGSTRAKRLNRKDIDTLCDGLHSDGGNLYLRVRGNGRSWVFRYKLSGKTHELGMGSTELVSLAEARKKALEMRVSISKGEPPVRKRMLLAAGATKIANAKACLDSIVEKALQNRVKTGRATASRYTKVKLGQYRKHVSIRIGKIPLTELTVADVVDVVNTVPAGTYRDVYGILSVSLKYAKDLGIIKGEIPLTPSLVWKRDDTKHLVAIPWQEIPEAFKKIKSHEHLPSARLLMATMLCVNRLSELSRLECRSVDLPNRRFTLARTKTTNSPVDFPIPQQAVELFSHPGSSGYVFEGRGGGIQSACSVLNRLKAFLSRDDVTVHGFRSSFSTWCADNGKDSEIRERCLNHVIDNKVAASYQRSDLLERRRALLQEWADYVTSSCDQ